MTYKVTRKVIKRNGQLVEFQHEKPYNAVFSAVASLDYYDASEDESCIAAIANECVEHLGLAMQGTNEPISVEQIQDILEYALMDQSEHEAARAFILYRDKQAKLRVPISNVDPMSLNQYINVSKYAAFLPEKGRREIKDETFMRSRMMHKDHFAGHKNAETLMSIIDESFDNMCLGFGVPSMRSMQFAGDAIETNNARMYNCAFTLVNRGRVFQEIFWCLLSGSGMGFSVRHKHVRHLPAIKKTDIDQVEHFEIEDTIEGWADALGALMNAYFRTGSFIEFSYVNIRRVGTLLKTSGGIAPGHVPLRVLLEKLRAYLDAIPHSKLRPIQCTDIICHAAKAVLAGGIRRSSLIGLFDGGDTEMLYCKAPGNFNCMPGQELNEHRQMANMSACLSRDLTQREEFDRVLMIAAEGYGGEPAVAWMKNEDCGYNPCVEIGMDPRYAEDWENFEDRSLDFDWKDYKNLHEQGSYTWTRQKSHELLAVNNIDVLMEEASNSSPQAIVDPVEVYGAATGVQFCNLSEVNVAMCRTQKEFIYACRACSAVGTLQAAYTSFAYLGPVTEAIVKRDALIGVSITGIFDRPELGLDPETLEHGAAEVLLMNARVAGLIDINPAARCTAGKPSGTASLTLQGITDDGRMYSPIASGAHAHHAHRYFRRVTANRHEPAAQVFKNANPHAVEVKPDGDWCLTFPVMAPEGCPTVKSMSAIEHVEAIVLLNEHWIKPGHRRGDVQHNVSCTVCFSPEEQQALTDLMWEKRDSVGAMTTMPKTSDKLWPYAPREEVVTEADEAKWRHLIDNWTNIDWSQDGITAKAGDGHHADMRANVAACEGPLCEINFGEKR